MAIERVGRNAMGYGLAGLNRLAGLPIIDRLGIRKATERAVYHGARSGFRAVGTVNRTFSKPSGKADVGRQARARSTGVFDLTPTDDQQMMVDLVSEFAGDVLRPAAEKSESTNEAPTDVLQQTSELGLTLIGLPESLGGLSDERSATTGVLVTEALAHGDMGLAVACLAPGAVATAISLWGSAEQQQTYLPAFTGSDVPGAALAIAEPRALFDPTTLETSARTTPDGYVLSGTKSAVVRGQESELFVVAADLDGSGPALFIVESGTSGVTLAPDPGMGLRAAGLSRLVLEDVTLARDGLLAEGEDYLDCIRLSRLAWCALALGGGRAVLEYVTPYVKERKAFGEPIANRQSVAFMVANIAIELEGMRLASYRAASRAEQGLPFAREAAIAKRLCSEYAMVIGTDGVQLLGGHGFVKEHPVERWYRDLRSIGVMEGALLV